MEKVVSTLMDGYERQLELYEGLRSLAHDEEGEHVVPTDHKAVLARLHEKASVLEEIARIEEELVPYKSAWDRTHRNEPPEAVARLTALLEKIATVLSETLALEEEGQRRFARAENLAPRRDALVPTARASDYREFEPAKEQLSVRR